ncbi:hypothetical protein EJ04DRAFT_549858 [Polyplosphaeria fusca]|uniref:Uncharacterized protein n=1 Tax=Polyplosphaeria fusca TaxID=682080 RepID=A0A9P4R3G7_9PLEO|nr:hypothetical protein EJ04DRAFT_549858 [Polyplosphaeria fusca]
MPVNWQDADTKDRLLASIIGSFDSNVNCKEVARLFGSDTTYNAIENFLRKPKKLAVKLKEEAKDRAGPAASPFKPKGKKAAALLEGVKTGRVTKKKATVNGSPGKKVAAVKKEDSDEGFASIDQSGGEGNEEEDSAWM